MSTEKLKLPVMAFIDVETTGLSTAYHDRICEIAVLRCQGQRKVTHWQSLVNPCRPISPAASAVNSITNKMVARSPLFKQVSAKFLELIEGAVLVCHNAPFDLSFLSAELEDCGLTLPNLPVIDTLKIARQHFDFPSNSLGNIAAYLEIDVKEKHRAMADVYTTHKIFSYFWSELNAQGIEQIDQLLTSHIWFPRSGRREVLNLPPLLEEAIRSGRNVYLSYLSRNGEETKRVVRPIKIINRFDYLCLEGFCQLRNERRTFRLDRIIKMKILSS
ncbi:MAG: exonuclease domain-containing protein [Endomicrobiales bacterium]